VALKEPRVLLAVSSLSAGGSERVISQIANLWAEKGWKIAVLTFAIDQKDQYTLDPRVERVVLDLLWDSANNWQTVRSIIRRSQLLRSAILRFKPDVVVSFLEQVNIRILAALLGTGVPTIVSERTDPREHEVGPGWRLARRVLYPLADIVVVQTDSVAAWARRFLPDRKVQVIPNFVPALPPETSADQRNSNELLAVGRLSRVKGLDLLLRAFAVSGLKGTGGRLTILGEGPERAFLESLAGELGITEAVSLPGIVQDPERWMAQCALFVLPSRYEGFPNALLEAMAMGCAVVAADCPSGPRELVLDGENGLLVPPENIEALAAALKTLMGDAALRRRLGERAVSVRQRFAREAIIERWESLILNCIGAG